jgi:hypothetical protein
LEAVLRKLETHGYHKHREVDEREMTKWQCVICGRIVPKYSLVSDHVLEHVKEREREK